MKAIYSFTATRNVGHLPAIIHRHYLTTTMKNVFERAEDYSLNERNDDKAAKLLNPILSPWIQNEYNKVAMPSDFEAKNVNTKTDVLPWLANIFRSFFGCKCDDGCKDRIKELVTLYPNYKDEDFNNILHLAAIKKADKNKDIYDDLLKFLGKKAQESLQQKNKWEDTPITIAVQFENIDFLRSVREIINMPKKEDMADVQLSKIFNEKREVISDAKADLLSSILFDENSENTPITGVSEVAEM